MREWVREAVILGNKKWKSEKQKINWTAILQPTDTDEEEFRLKLPGGQK